MASVVPQWLTGKGGCGGFTPSTRARLPTKRSRLSGKGGCRGFTLLETVVALAIFAAGAMALYGLFNTNLIALQRVQATEEHLPVVRNAIEVLASVNPWHQSAGEFEFDGYLVNWQAQLIEPVRHGQTNTGMMSGFDLGLYELEFAVTDAGRHLGTWRMRAVGYERVRGLPPGEDIF